MDHVCVHGPCWWRCLRPWTWPWSWPWLDLLTGPRDLLITMNFSGDHWALGWCWWPPLTCSAHLIWGLGDRAGAVRTLPIQPGCHPGSRLPCPTDQSVCPSSPSPQPAAGGQGGRSSPFWEQRLILPIILRSLALTATGNVSSDIVFVLFIVV